MPIGRLTVSGPDGPRRYADAELGGSWFAKPANRAEAPAPETQPEAATPADNGGRNTTPEPAADPNSRHTTTDQPADTNNRHTTAAQPANPNNRHTTATQPADPNHPHTATAQPADTNHRDTATAQAAAAGGAPAETGMVLDFDITGLVNGLTTGEQPTVAPAGKPTAEPTGKPTAEPTAEPATPQDQDDPRRGSPTAADLAAIRWRLDGGTLREVVDDHDALRDLGERLDEPIAVETDHAARAGLLSVRAEVYRLLGELGMAAAASRLALAHAETAGNPQATVIAQAELAHVLRLRGDFSEADRLFEEAASSEAAAELRSVVHENAGRCCFDQGRHMEALDHFGRAVRLGREDDTDLAERIEVSLEAVYIRVLRDGWGPYPRLRREIIGSKRPDPAAEPA